MDLTISLKFSPDLRKYGYIKASVRNLKQP